PVKPPSHRDPRGGSMSALNVRPMPEPFTRTEIARYYAYRAPQVRLRGSELRGPCPLHQGTRDSFSINPETGDWFCHSACGRGGSLVMFEIEFTGQSFARAAAEARMIVGRVEESSKRRILQVYDYVDESSKLLFQCVRFEPKG